MLLKEDPNDKKIYDYIGCAFPEGIMSTDQNLLFNNNQIAKVYSYGLIDEEVRIFHKNLDEKVDEMIKALKQNNN